MRRSTLYWLILIIALLAAAPLWGPGIVNTRGGGDSPFLLQRTLAVAESLQHGIFPPRWMAHAAYDLGYPFFNHYAALPYYLSGGLTALGLSPIIAIQTTQTFGFILAALAMALLAERFYKNQTAILLASVAYTFAPFHMVNVYVRGDSLSEFYAFIWYPLILWTLDRLIETPSRNRIATATLAYTGLILTHNVSAVIFSPFALLYVVILAIRQRSTIGREKRLKWAITLIAPFLLGIALTAGFWMPAILETGYGQMGQEFTAGYFHYSNHFRDANLVQRTFLFNYDVAGNVENAGPFTMGLSQAALALLGSTILVWQLVRSNKNNTVTHTSIALYCLAGLAISTLMITPLSKLLWEYLPLLETTQFPWRFLSVQACFTAIATGDLGAWLYQWLRRTSDKIPAHALIGLVLCSVLIISARGALKPDRLLIDTQDVTWDNQLLYEAFTGNIGTTIRYEYLPKDVIPRLYISEAVLEGQGGLSTDADVALNYTLQKRTPNQQVWRVSLDSGDAPVTFPLNWWPGWQATIDGENTNTYPMIGSGRLTLDLKAGSHIVDLQLRNTPLRTAATVISLIMLCGGLGLLLTKKQRAEIIKAARKIGNAGLEHIALPLLIAFVPCMVFNFSTPVDNGMRVFDFTQMPYPHAGPVDFQIAQLKDIQTPGIAEPGETLTLPMQWDVTTEDSLTATLRLVSPATPRHGTPYTLAETTVSIPQGENTQPAALQLPDDLTRGLYLLEVHLRGSNGEIFAQTAQGHTMGTLYAGALRVLHGPSQRADAPLLAHLGNGALTLHTIATNQPQPDQLQVKMHWSTTGTPRNWSLSLRLSDITGQPIASKDLQPGYGYLPTTLWKPGEAITDYVTLTLPRGLAPGTYTLKVITYLEATMGEQGEVEIPVTLTEVTRQEPCNFCDLERRAGKRPCEAAGIQLRRVDMPDDIQEGEPLAFKVEWWAVAAPTADLTARWEVLKADGSVLTTAEGPLAPGSRPTAWPRYTWVRTPVQLDLPPTLSEGPYSLRVTLLDDETPRNACEVVDTLPITLRQRSFEIPNLPYVQTASFEDALNLVGYDWHKDKADLSLTLWWQAGNNTPRQDYKRFVHLVDAATGLTAAQDDAMPRDWTYPTSWWAAGEVVSETVTLDLNSLPNGTYHLAVGWYDEKTGERLNANGHTMPDGRISLTETTFQKP